MTVYCCAILFSSAIVPRI